MNITLKTVNLKDGSTAIKLESPYHPDLPPRLRNLGGHGWSDAAKAWYLPADVESEIRAICLDIYGIDPLAEQSADLVTVKMDVSGHSFGENLWEFGRQLLRRPSRDGAVRSGEGVSIISGGFARSGGSRNNPRIGGADDNTILVIRNVPRHMALAYDDLPIEIVEPTTAKQ